MFDLETGKKYVFLGFLKVSLSFETNACTLFFTCCFKQAIPKYVSGKVLKYLLAKVSNLKLNSTSQIIS